MSAVRTDVADYLHWFNTERPHSSLDRLTPNETYLDLLSKQKVAA